MVKVFVALGGALGSAVMVAVLAVAAAFGQVPGIGSSPTASVSATASASASAAPSAGLGPEVPPAWVTLDRQAAATCPDLPWSVLAAIGTVESYSGQSNAAGVWSGANSAGAEGPMQFEPATFAVYATVGPGGASPASPYDPIDAVYTAAAMLCADGGASPATLRAAVLGYNHSVPYADTVLTLAVAFGDDPVADAVAVAALEFAAAQLNTPYLWGGTGTGGFDCSGLVQAAYRSAGVALPRVAQDQYDAGPAVPGGSPVEPGDLLFFGTGPSGVDHVGLYVGDGEMIDAPHAGALVRFDAADWSGLVGVTRPAG
jgi:cell wall-associated NlpC family hydrolase